MKSKLSFALLWGLLLLLMFTVSCDRRTMATQAPLHVPMDTEPIFTDTPAPTCTPNATPEPTPTPTPTSTPTPTPVPITKPRITLVGGPQFTVDAAFTFEEPGFIATDYLGLDLTDRVQIEGEVVPYLVGTYILTYTVTDDLEQTASAQRFVHVKPVDMPEIIMPPEKTIYLTFDDGPCGLTRQLLDTLKKYDVKATFFVIGNKVGARPLIRRAFEEGHSIGVHSYTHEYKDIYASEEAFFQDFLATQEVIYEQTGQYTRIFRFPGGSANTASRGNPGIMTRLTKIMEDMGYRYFDWNVRSEDTGAKSTTASVVGMVCAGLRNHTDFAIVLQHDIKPHSVIAVATIIEWGLEHGYTFRPLDLTSPVLHSIPQN